MLKDISEHQPADLDTFLSYEVFCSKIASYQEQIRTAFLETPITNEAYKNVVKDIEIVLSDNSDLTPLTKVARYLHLGQGLTANPFLALEISKTLAQNCEGYRDRELQYFYALLLASHEDYFKDDALKIIKKLISENYLPAVVRYGTYLETGSLGVKQNKKLAEDYYRQAANAGHVVGLSCLARINRKKSNAFKKMYGWALTAKLVLLLPIAFYRMKSQYDDRDTFY